MLLKKYIVAQLLPNGKVVCSDKSERAKREHKFLWEKKSRTTFLIAFLYKEEDKVMMWYYDMAVPLIQGIAHCAFIPNTMLFIVKKRLLQYQVHRNLLPCSWLALGRVDKVTSDIGQCL